MFKILIVEDEELIRKGLAYTFNWINYDCVVIGEARNGKEGYELINEKKPDIVITDIKMPLLDGLEMLGSFEKRDFETIVISGYAEFDYAKKAIEYDVSEFMLKPLDHNELGNVIQKITKKICDKKMINTISENIKDFSEIVLLDLELYFHNSNYESWMIPKVMEYISKNYSRKANINEIADELRVSATYLSKKFKNETKHTFNAFLNKYRIQKAIKLINEDNMKIYEIAELVGFTEYKYFSKVFKKYLKHSPTEFMNVNLYIKNKKS